MPTGALTGYLDVAQVVLYAFWIFFAGLIFYLRREDRREGYPLEPHPGDRTVRTDAEFIPLIPSPKTFLLPHGGTATSGRKDAMELRAEAVAPWPGAPLEPTGDPMRAEVGPGAYALREEVPERTAEGQPMIVPMRVASEFSVETRDPDPRGMEVVDANRVVAGTVSDIWVDRAEPQVRYFEVELAGSAPTPAPSGTGTEGEGTEEAATPPPATQQATKVLLPIGFARINRGWRRVEVNAIFARHFADVPRLANPDQVTKREEDRIMAYYAAGHRYAEASRTEPLL